VTVAFHSPAQQLACRSPESNASETASYRDVVDVNPRSPAKSDTTIDAAACSIEVAGCGAPAMRGPKVQRPLGAEVAHGLAATSAIASNVIR
jgi:hypothetical protein